MCFTALQAAASWLALIVVVLVIIADSLWRTFPHKISMEESNAEVVCTLETIANLTQETELSLDRFEQGNYNLTANSNTATLHNKSL